MSQSHASSEAMPTAWQLVGAMVHGVSRPTRQLTMAGSRVVAPTSRAERIELPADWHIVPGFIDAHIHGAVGHDVMDARPETLSAMASYLPSEGTTAFLATTMTAPATAIDQALENVANFRAGPGMAEMLGVHLEGPFVNPDRAGAQPVAHITAPDCAQFDRWQQLSGHGIRVVTLAPEQPGGHDLVQHLSEQGVIAAMGHSVCRAAQAEAAIQAGASRGTHLFNAMEGLHHRQPGLACALLSHDTVRSEIIADGVHVAPAMVRLAWQAAGSRRLMAITDAMRAKGLADGDHELGGQPVKVINGEARLVDGTLAGSVLTFDAAFRNLLDFTGCELAEAVAMTSTNTAFDLGVSDRKGRLEVGYDADVVVLDDKLNVRLTLCRGQVAHDSDEMG